MVSVTIKLHCGLDWQWKRLEIIANSEAEAIEVARNTYTYTDKPYSDEKEDSLEVLESEEINYFYRELEY